MNWSILIVDDEPMTRNIMRIMLEHVGMTVFEAEDGVDALEKINDERPDILLLDVMMPRMDGIEVCEKLRREPETAVLPIIMFSGKTQPTAVAAGLAAGADKYLCKPVSHKDLLNHIDELMQAVPTTI